MFDIITKPYVYIVKDILADKRYIGMRYRNEKPWQEDLGKEYFTSSKHIKNSWQEFPLNFQIESVEEFDTADEAANYELAQLEAIPKEERVHWHNINFASKAMLHTQESCQAISESKKGMVFTEEHRANLSKAMTGKKRSADARHKISQGKKGKPLSEEHRSNISGSKMGVKKTEETRANMSAGQRIRHACASAEKKKNEAKVKESLQETGCPF